MTYFGVLAVFLLPPLLLLVGLSVYRGNLRRIEYLAVFRPRADCSHLHDPLG